MSVHDAPASSIAVRLRDALGALPRGERSVARTLLNAYPIAGLGTLAELATRSGVSTPTVLRLLTRLGFEGFSDFQRALHLELNERMANVFEDYPVAVRDGQSIAAASLAQAAASIEATAQALADAEFDAAVRLLGDKRLAVHAIGGSFSQSVALLLTLDLGVLRPRVRFLPYGSAELTDALAEAGKRDVIVAYDFRRYSDSTLAIARYVAARGGHIILITDRWLSPVAPIAETVLVARTEAPSPFDSLTAATALTEALVAGVGACLEPEARPRAEAIRRLNDSVAAESDSGRDDRTSGETG